VEKEVLIDAIKGRGFNSIEKAVKYTHFELAKFCGNSWNEDWEWRMDKLNELNDRELKAIYLDLIDDS